MRTARILMALCAFAFLGCGDDASGGGDGGGGTDGAPAGDGGDGDGGGGGACAVEPTFADGIEPSAVVHVASDGDDGDGDGSEASPFATIGRAAAEAEPGTAIRIHPGTYPGDTYVQNLRGTAEAPIWIGGAPGQARPILSGGGQGLHLTRVAYLVVHDLEVVGSANNGINCDDGGAYDDPTATHHVVFRNLFIHDIGSDGNQDCLKLSGVYDHWVLDSELTRCGGGGSGSGVDHVGCHRGVIAGNHFHDLSANAVQSKGGSADIVIRGNLIEDAGHRALNMGGSTGAEYFRPPLSATAPNAEARRILAYGNIIIGAQAAAAFVGCVDCLFANNTVVNPANWVARILQETVTFDAYAFEPASNGRFVNNLIYFERAQLSSFVNVGANTSPESFTFANNLWYAHDDPSQSAPSLPVTETAPVIGQDPLLDANYQPAPTSPAAAAGTPLPEVAGDYTGACYPTPPSIGAHALP